MCQVPFPCVALIRRGVELGGGRGRETCLTASGIPFFGLAAVVVHRESPAAFWSANSVMEVEPGESVERFSYKREG